MYIINKTSKIGRVFPDNSPKGSDEGDEGFYMILKIVIYPTLHQQLESMPCWEKMYCLLETAAYV